MCFDRGSQKRKLDNYLNFFQVLPHSYPCGGMLKLSYSVDVRALQGPSSHGCRIYVVRFVRGEALHHPIFMTHPRCLFKAVRPKLVMLKSFEEAVTAVDEMFTVAFQTAGRT